MTVRDSRRLTGPNVFWERPGAVLEVELDAALTGSAVGEWEKQARRILAAVGWERERCATRIFPGGASLALSAPIDALYAATEVNEWAWSAAQATLDGNLEPDLAAAAERLLETIAAERKPKLLALRHAARENGATFLADDDQASVGLGTGCKTWPVGNLPDPDDVAWADVHDVPVALVTGTNGKTTSVRLLAAMVAAAGKTPGLSSTDWIQIGDEILDTGDYSGPGGARAALRHPATEIALLETARGGMLRRGLAVPRADVALVTNVAEDHLGEWGVHDLAALADVKMIVARAARRLVLNADDPLIAERGIGRGGDILWFSLDPDSASGPPAAGDAGAACFLDGSSLVLREAGERLTILDVGDVPIAMGGAARHNVANALGAIGVARELGLPIEAMRQGLRAFASTPEENPGRLNVFELGGVTAILDFAHNPHGVAALLDMAAAMPAARRCVLIGQAGDRDDESIRDLARVAWRGRPDLVIVKELADYLRGREAGEIPAILEDELRRQGAPAEAVAHAASDLDAVVRALAWSRPGDLLLLAIHEQRSKVIDLLRRLSEEPWRPGSPLPEVENSSQAGAE